MSNMCKQFQRWYSKDLHKFIYANNRVFLPPNHRFRGHQKNQFDGKVENRGPPLILGPDDWLNKYEDAKSKAWEDFFDQVYSIQGLEQVVVNMLNAMKRKYIFYELPYWKDLLISHLYAHLQKCPRFYISTYIRKREAQLVLKERYCYFTYQV